MSKKTKQIETEFDVAKVAFKSPQSPMAEAYRVLRTNLGFSGFEAPFKSVLVTSVSARDGKSTIVANLAMVCAQAGYNVMLVDCDLRRPVQHKIFQVPNNTGFTTCIMNGTNPEEASFELTVPNLRILTSGPIPPNPAEILNSHKVKIQWSSLASKYDYIFIDSPPLLAVSDASILASQVDATLLVLRSGVTRVDEARQAQEQLKMANSRILGVVLNQVKMDTKNYYYSSLA